MVISNSFQEECYEKLTLKIKQNGRVIICYRWTVKTKKATGRIHIALMCYNWMSFIIDSNGNTQVKNKHLQKSKKEREQILCKKSGMPIVSLFGMLAMQWNKNPNREASCWLDFDSQFWGHWLFWCGWVCHWSQCSWQGGNGRGCHSWKIHWFVVVFVCRDITWWLREDWGVNTTELD